MPYGPTEYSEWRTEIGEKIIKAFNNFFKRAWIGFSYGIGASLAVALLFIFIMMNK